MKNRIKLFHPVEMHKQIMMYVQEKKQRIQKIAIAKKIHSHLKSQIYEQVQNYAKQKKS